MLKFDFLCEGLFKNDLYGVVKPIISINEYESKLAKNNMVIAFYATCKDAAEDLSVFLEKSSIDAILDAEVSSAPDEDGDYVVFIEYDAKIKAKTIMETLDIVQYLCDIKEWRFEAYKLPRQYPLNYDNIKKYLEFCKKLNI